MPSLYYRRVLPSRSERKRAEKAEGADDRLTFLRRKQCSSEKGEGAEGREEKIAVTGKKGFTIEAEKNSGVQKKEKSSCPAVFERQSNCLVYPPGVEPGLDGVGGRNVIQLHYEYLCFSESETIIA